MTTKVPYRISEIDFKNIQYTDIKSNSRKTIVYLKYLDNNKLKNIVFQTPSFLSNNTLQCKNNMYELDVPLIGKEIEKMNRFIKFIESLDKKIINDAKINNNWFDKYPDVKKMRYQKTIRESIESNNGVIRMKLLRNTDFETLVQLNNNKIEIEETPTNCWLKAILEVYAIWINKDGFGLFIRPILLSFTPCTKIAYDYKLIEDSEENEVEEVVDTIQDNSIFIRSESEITSSVLEMPNRHSDEEEVNSSDDPVVNNDLSSTTSPDA